MAKLTKTSTPGIYRRHVKGCDGRGRCDCTYAIVWRHRGKQYTETHRTLALAREAKREHEADVARGEFSELSRATLHEYAREWIERYQGTGRRGFRQETRDDYRWNLERYALRYFSSDVKLGELSPRMVADFIGWLARQQTRRGRPFSDSGVRNAFKPLSVCLATARREGLIRHNPANDAVLPHREVVDDEEKARPFPRLEVDGETVESMVVQGIDAEHRLMFELLAATGLRRSELLALEGRHLMLTTDQPHIKVRQRIRRRRGEGLVIGPLKSRYARRDIPLPPGLTGRLAALDVPADSLAFTTTTGTPHDPDNLYRRVLSPACEEAGVSWAAFHTFRHTVASRLFAEGRNAVQVQRWLGHHSPSFTLDTYVHLLDADLGAPLNPRT
jgi:integrase